MSEHARVRWGVLGPGRIADQEVPDVALVPGSEVVAVGSRSQQRADAFAARHGIARAHGSYRALLADDGIDAVYVATPHPQHRELTLAAIDAGKAVLVEKSFTATAAGTREVVARSRSAGVFVMEAMWTRFQPAVLRVGELLADGAIGEVTGVQADLGVLAPEDPTDRFWDPAQGGGALLDLGVYLVSFAQLVLGDPDRVVAHGSRAETGVEREASLLLGYDDGRAATLSMSLRSPMPGGARVFGTAGWIDVPPRFHHPSRLVLHRHGHDPQTLELPPTGRGYSHQFAEVARCLGAGLTESPRMPLADTVAVMDVLTEAATQLGVTQHEDDSALA
ncbi:MAG: Gfo/Idh/MocA family oxidoreductase [Mycobacteriaceae bacterium]